MLDTRFGNQIDARVTPSQQSSMYSPKTVQGRPSAYLRTPMPTEDPGSAQMKKF